MTDTPKIDAFKPHTVGPLRGFIEVTLPSGMKLHGCTVMQKDGRARVMPPSKPMIGRDGTAMVGADGKRRYEPMVSFATREAQDRFSAQVLEAPRLQFPEALEP